MNSFCLLRHTTWLSALAVAIVFSASASWSVAAVLPLDEVGNYRVGFQRRGEPVTELPVGWTGGLESSTGAACEPMGVQQGKEAWLLHCPWKGKTGVTFQEFSVAVPTTKPAVLRGLTALREDAVGKSDGVVCRVFVNGEKRFETHRKDAAWTPFEIDLSAEAGKTAVLRFETDPGPDDNSSFDFSLWAERRIESPDSRASMPSRLVAPLPDLRRLTTGKGGGVVPPSGFDGKTQVTVSAESAVLQYGGEDGMLEYRWEPDANDALFGRIVLQATPVGGQTTETPLATQARLDWTVPAQLVSSRLGLLVGPEAAKPSTGAVLTRTYDIGGQTASLIATATLQNKSLVLDVSCDQPLVRAFEGGAWGPVPRRRWVKVPYYSSAIQFLENENLFAGGALDWTASQASSQNGTRAVYDPRTDGTRNLLRERLIFTAAWHLDEILPNVPNPASPYREELSQQVILDVWGGSYASNLEKLHTLAAAGCYGDAATMILHEWQFGGYDNKLPQHVPALDTLGGDAGLAGLVKSAAADGIRTALHENYVDYYPNFPGYTEKDIAVNPDGSRVNAWFHPGTKIQSFGVKPSRMLPLAESQGSEILRRYGTAASYLDVHSAVPPWFHVDAEPSQPGAGEFGSVWSAHRDLWNYERKLHHGPVFGEGNNHWYWSGLLDGVEAQFGQGWPDGQGLNAPLFVNFDLLKIHPLQLNHGMGYYSRWWSQGPDADHSRLSLLDRYRMQEVAYGHQGFLGDDAWNEPGLAWLESHLLPPLTTRTALASPVAIEYALGERWVDASTVIRERGDFSRLRVRYDNGLTLWANGGATPLKLDGVTLPLDGWLARGEGPTTGFTAGTTLRDGIVSDYAETPDSIFANARAVDDWQDGGGATKIRPMVADFAPVNSRRLRFSYRWVVEQALKDDLICFVHFVPTPAEATLDNIRFQQDHALKVPTSRWQVGQSVEDGPWELDLPTDLAPGDYLWTIGLYGPNTGRLKLPGRSDAHNRLVLGTLHVAGDAPPTFVPAAPGPKSVASLNAESRVLDFGPVRTNGSVFVQREGDEWVLRPFPNDRPFEVELSAARFGSMPGVRIESGWWRLPLTGKTAYRWPVTPPTNETRGR